MSDSSLVAVLPSRREAEAAMRHLQAAGVPPSALSLVLPESPARREEHGENEGIGAAIGAVVGGAGGASVALGTVGLLVPGVGPVVAIGALATALLGSAGGAAIGSALDRAATEAGAPGGPADGPDACRQALRDGDVLLVVSTDGDRERRAALLREAHARQVAVVPNGWWRALELRAPGGSAG